MQVLTGFPCSYEKFFPGLTDDLMAPNRSYLPLRKTKYCNFFLISPTHKAVREMKKNLKTKLAVVLTVALVSVLSVAFLGSQESRDFRIGKNLDIFYSLFRELNTFYVDEIDPDKVIKSGIDNMLKTLDPYTVYIPESEMDDFNFMTTGKYGGIGCQVRNNGDYAIVTEIYRGFPADQAGIKSGDIIKKVDGNSLKGLGTDRVSDRLKGDPGTEISLTIERDGKENEYKIKRARIAVPPVPYYGIIDSTTGYIRFTNFTQNCVVEVKKAVVALRSKNPTSIILDIRSNPGGLLTEAVELVNLFVGPGNDVVRTKGKVKQFDSEYKTNDQAVDEKIPIAVIINSGSASASEIVAGAIQDLDRGVIVGQRSYGKGLVQITRPLSYNTQLKVTTAKYYIPSGRCIQALDFSHPNEDGSVGYIPDSLISEFKTKGGRTVKDGGGIAPDVEVVPETLSQLATELYLRNYIFDYATSYYWAHPQIKTPDQFKFTDKDFADFTKFLADRKFNYRTETEEIFSELVTTARREKYYEMHKDLFTSLEKDITHDLSEDLQNFKSEISELIEDEIIGRYFYQEGAIEWSLRKDDQVRKAVEILNNKGLYTNILSGKQPGVITSAESATIHSFVRLDNQKSIGNI
jgi:carboxyl-terminal processing protease